MSPLQLVHRPADTSFVANQLRTDGIAADEADDIGGNLLIRQLENSGVELPRGKALPIQGQAQPFQALPGQVFWPGADDLQCGDFVHVRLYIF